MLKRMICIGIVCVMILGISSAIPAKNTPQEEAVSYMVEQGILQGYPDGSLGIDRSITRAEFTKMICLVKGLEADDDVAIGFKDVSPIDWASDYIRAAAQANIIGGFEDGTFRANENITYEQAAKMTLYAFGTQGLGYPYQVMSTAIDFGIFDAVPAVIGEKACRGDIALMLYRAIMAEKETAADRAREERLAKEAQENEKPSSNASNGNYNSPPSSGTGGGSAAAPAPMPSDGGYYENADMDALPSDGVYYGYSAEEYTANGENIFKDVRTSPLSTFSIDVDTASYSNVRRFLLRGETPPKGAVRVEELINYFDYSYPQPSGNDPFSVTTEVQVCPWNQNHLLAMVALQGKELATAQRAPSNLVFLLDVSGSMYSQEKLPLVQQAMKLLLTQLDARDRISIVTYAGSTEVVLEGARGDEKEKILDAIFRLNAGGSTAGAAGITLAYEAAEKNKIDGNNRIILCTDGDFNVGIYSNAELEELISEKRNNGIFLSVLGFGMGNYKDNKMELLADKGDGNYAYIDNLREAKKVLVDDMTKTLFTIAKDVKLQVEFNPNFAGQYRLIGYENRKLENEDFANDAKDAGELGAGHTVTAFYEIIPPDGSSTSDLRYQTSSATNMEELMTVNLRYKEPSASESKLIQHTVKAQVDAEMSENFAFASAVAQFGMYLNRSEFMGNTTLDAILNRAETARGEDRFGLRAELIQLIGLVRYLQINGN